MAKDLVYICVIMGYNVLMATKPTQIEVTVTDLFNGPGRRFPWSSHFKCDGPDGTRFTNSDRTTLKQALTRRYGKVELVINDQRQHGPRGTYK